MCILNQGNILGTGESDGDILAKMLQSLDDIK